MRQVEFFDGYTSSSAPVSGGRSARAAISNGATSVTVTFSEAMDDADYGVVATMENTTDSLAEFQPVTITAKTANGFTASWSSPVGSANYLLAYSVQGDQ